MSRQFSQSGFLLFLPYLVLGCMLAHSMDDDGLILNFALGPSTGAVSRLARPAPKQGTWKQRLKIKKGIQRKERKAALENSARTILNSEFTGVRVNEGMAGAYGKQKGGTDVVVPNELGKTLVDSRTKPSSVVKVLHGKPQVVSSLFTSNPQIVKHDLAPTRTVLGAPSNAPATDAVTFESLGLGSALSAHLAAKLSALRPTQIQRRAIPVLLGPVRLPETEDADTVLQAETGSGKTLAYLLPIVHRLILSPAAGRSAGTLAIVLTPTRELAQQVLGMLQAVLSMPPSGTQRGHWIVPGLVIGGDKKKSEKARLRKGVSVLVATPGRLLDHLQNTKSFEVGNLRWLVLDEADRLLDLGFEETLKAIMEVLNERTGGRKVKGKHEGSEVWPRERQTVLCSATLRDDVRRLAGTSLRNPIFIKGQGEEGEDGGVKRLGGEVAEKEADAMDVDTVVPGDKFSTPNQLKQTYVLVPAKLRLVTLTAMLRLCFAARRKGLESKMDNKVVVFFSCCDSVDFHHDLFANAGKEMNGGSDNEDEEEGSEEESPEHKVLREVLRSQNGEIASHDDDATDSHSTTHPSSSASSFVVGTVLPDVPLYRLHGDLAQASRTQTYQAFRSARKGVLLCTDVAARGLDLPDVTRIVQYDAPSDLRDYVHRAGRTARLGKRGEATLFLLPSEEEYIGVLKGQGIAPDQYKIEGILMGLVEGGKGDYQVPATELQGKFERYVLGNEKVFFLLFFFYF